MLLGFHFVGHNQWMEKSIDCGVCNLDCPFFNAITSLFWHLFGIKGVHVKYFLNFMIFIQKMDSFETKVLCHMRVF